MKKLLSIIVLCSYMLCALGITFSFHHCRGHLKYVNIHPGKEKKCCKGKKMPRSCCNTIKVAFKKGDDKGQSNFEFKTKTSEYNKDLAVPVTIYAIGYIPGKYFFRQDNRFRPPPLRAPAIPLYKANSVYLI